MANWYDEHIEEPIQDLVRLLRDNGFNTECSCGHEMYVQCQYICEGETMRLHHLLFNNGYRNYHIKIDLRVDDGHSFSTIEITIYSQSGVPDDTPRT